MSTPMEWQSAYESSEAQVDRQHQHLFEYVNQLGGVIETVRGGTPIPTKAVNDLLQFVGMYVNVHFAYEEMCFAMRGCPLAKKNIEMHNKLIEFYSGFCEQAKAGITLDMLETLHGTLNHWLVNHICKLDINLRDHPQDKTHRHRAASRRQFR